MMNFERNEIKEMIRLLNMVRTLDARIGQGIFPIVCKTIVFFTNCHAEVSPMFPFKTQFLCFLLDRLTDAKRRLFSTNF